MTGCTMNHFFSNIRSYYKLEQPNKLQLEDLFDETRDHKSSLSGAGPLHTDYVDRGLMELARKLNQVSENKR